MVPGGSQIKDKYNTRRGRARRVRRGRESALLSELQAVSIFSGDRRDLYRSEHLRLTQGVSDVLCLDNALALESNTVPLSGTARLRGSGSGGWCPWRCNRSAVRVGRCCRAGCRCCSLSTVGRAAPTRILDLRWLKDLCLRRRSPSTQRYSLSLHDAVERRLSDTKPRPDVRRQCVGLRIQPRDLASLIHAHSPTTGTAGLDLAPLRFVGALGRNIFHGFDNAQLTLHFFQTCNPRTRCPAPYSNRVVWRGVPARFVPPRKPPWKCRMECQGSQDGRARAYLREELPSLRGRQAEHSL
jgi:hypothetical protein